MMTRVRRTRIVKTVIKRKLNALVESYGATGTALILVATVALLPVPIPGTSLLPIGVAKIVKKIFSY